MVNCRESCRKLTPLSYLLHDSGFPFTERSVTSEFVFDEFHLYLDSPLGLFAGLNSCRRGHGLPLPRPSVKHRRRISVRIVVSIQVGRVNIFEDKVVWRGQLWSCAVSSRRINASVQSSDASVVRDHTGVAVCLHGIGKGKNTSRRLPYSVPSAINGKGVLWLVVSLRVEYSSLASTFLALKWIFLLRRLLIYSLTVMLKMHLQN